MSQVSRREGKKRAGWCSGIVRGAAVGDFKGVAVAAGSFNP